MSKNFSLVDLISEADTFTDVDGTQYEVSSLDDFGAVERARIRKFQRQLVATEKVLNTSEDDAALTRAIEEQDLVLGQHGLNTDLPSHLVLVHHLFHVLRMLQEIRHRLFTDFLQIRHTTTV
jgi:hypothetical protein